MRKRGVAVEEEDEQQPKHPETDIVLKVTEQLMAADYLVDSLLRLFLPLDYSQSSHVQLLEAYLQELHVILAEVVNTADIVGRL